MGYRKDMKRYEKMVSPCESPVYCSIVKVGCASPVRLPMSEKPRQKAEGEGEQEQTLFVGKN